MFKRVAVFGLFAGALLIAGPRAEAAQLTGAVAIAAQPQGAGQNPVIPVNALGAAVTLDLATGLDFTATGALTPGTPGVMVVNNATGDFTPLFGLHGLMDDFSFVGPGSPNYPFPPALFQLIVSPAFTFTMTSVHVGTQNSTLIDLTGTGIFTMAGFDPTPGVFAFQTNNTGGVFSFAGTEATVPEPGSMVLLGTGLIGLGSVLRRRLAK